MPGGVESCRDLNHRSDGMPDGSAKVKDALAQDPAYRPTRRVCMTSNLVRCREQNVEEPVEHAGGLATIGDLGPAETVDLVASES